MDQAEGVNAADEDGSDKSSEVNDEEEADEDGSDEVCFRCFFEFNLLILVFGSLCSF